MSKKKIDWIMHTIKEKISSGNAINLFYKISILILSVLSFILALFMIFTIQHTLTDNDKLYTYIGDTNTAKETPIFRWIHFGRVSFIT